MTIGQNGIPAASSWFAMFKETTFGTQTSASATSAIAFEPLNFNVKVEVESLRLDTIAKNRGLIKRMQGNKTISGSFEQYCHSEESALLLMNAMGGVVTSAVGSTGVYIHSISAGDFNTLTGISIKARKGSAHYWLYKGGRVNQLTISGNVGEPIKLTAEMMFQSATVTGDDISVALSISTVLPFNFTDAKYMWAAKDSTTAAGSMTTTDHEEFITGFELTINNNLEEARALGRNIVTSLPPKRREIGLKITQRFDTITAYNRFIQATVGSILIRITSPSSLSSDVFHELDIFMPKVQINSPDIEVSGPNEILVQEFECDVLVDDPMTTTGKDIAMTLLNATADYS